MTKIPKILQIAIISISVLVAVFIIFSLIFGKKEENIVKFLDSADAIKKFKAQVGNNQKNTDSKVSPLVKEAKQFALYLDPPPPPVQYNSANNQAIQQQKPVFTAPVVPIVTYDLLATIVDTNRPEASRAMIDLPGSGQKFVQQGQQVGHTIIEEIKNGSIIVKAGDKSEELMANIPPIPSLIKGSPNHIFKIYPDLKTESVHSTALENLPSTSPSPTPNRFSTSVRKVESPSSIRPVISSSRPSISSVPPSALKSPTRSSRNFPPAPSPEQEKKAMEELIAEMSKMKNEDGSSVMDAEMEKLIRTMNAENNTSTDAQGTPAQITNIEKSEPNKQE